MLKRKTNFTVSSIEQNAPRQTREDSPICCPPTRFYFIWDVEDKDITPAKTTADDKETEPKENDEEMPEVETELNQATIQVLKVGMPKKLHEERTLKLLKREWHGENGWFFGENGTISKIIKLSTNSEDEYVKNVKNEYVKVTNAPDDDVLFLKEVIASK